MTRSTRIAATAVLGAVAVAELLTSTSSVAATGHASHAPTFVTAKVKCVVIEHVDYPGLKNVPIYAPKVTWKLKHATGMALSVNDPHLVGSYGTYAGKSGSVILGAGCYQDEGTSTITLYSVGGHGKRAHKTIVKTGTKTRINPPPFG